MAHLAIRLSGARGFAELLADVDLGEGRLVAVALPGAVDAAPPAEALERLHQQERAAAAAMLPRRRRTFVGGRVALRRALRGVGAGEPPPMLSDDRGAPRLPGGFCGSIAHKDEIAVALAQRADGWARGVDVEPMRALSWALARRIVTPEERAVLEAEPDDDARGRALLRSFAAKEAIYKAIDPWLRRWVGFLEVVLHPVGDGLAVESRLGAEAPRLIIEARTLEAGDVLVAVARARPAA